MLSQHAYKTVDEAIDAITRYEELYESLTPYSKQYTLDDDSEIDSKSQNEQNDDLVDRVSVGIEENSIFNIL